MAIKKPIVTESGIEVDGAYFTPAHKHLDIIGLSGNIIFYAHANKAAHAAGKAPLPGVVKSYPFSREQFLAAQTMHQVELFPEYNELTLHDVLPDIFPEGAAGADTTVAQVLHGITEPASMPILYNFEARFCYGHAKTFKDTPVLDDDGKPVPGPDVPVLDGDGKPVLDGNGEPLMKSGPPLMRSFFEGAQDV